MNSGSNEAREIRALEEREFLDRRARLVSNFARSRRKEKREAKRIERIRTQRSLQPTRIIKQGLTGLGLVPRPRFTQVGAP